MTQEISGSVLGAVPSDHCLKYTFTGDAGCWSPDLKVKPKHAAVALQYPTAPCHLEETGPLSQGVQAGRKALIIHHKNGMEVRKKRPRGFKKDAQGVQASPLNPGCLFLPACHVVFFATRSWLAAKAPLYLG
jgi:hypothetical protein